MRRGVRWRLWAEVGVDSSRPEGRRWVLARRRVFGLAGGPPALRGGARVLERKFAGDAGGWVPNG